MATLTETAYYTRKGVKLLGFGIVAFIVLRILLGIIWAIWLAIFPPGPPPPTVAFGKLTKIKFPQTAIASTSANFNYSLEIVEGELPRTSQAMKVFFVPRPVPTFGSFEKMKAKASRLAFYSDPKRVPGKTDLWRFDDNANPLRHLEYDDTTGNWHLYYDFRFDPGLFVARSFPSQEKIISDALDLFDRLDLLSKDLSTGNRTVAYFKLDIDRLVLTTSLAQADAVAVTFNRATVSGELSGKRFFPVVYPDPKQGLVSVVFSGSDIQAKRIIDAKYYYSPIDLENWATYPTITLAGAYEDLKTGKAFVASVPTNNTKDIMIRKAYLAYLDLPEGQSYLQPVAVFSDEKGFTAYVPVISPVWLEE